MSVDFLEKILPTTGMYCVARVVGKGFAHSFHPTVDEAFIKAQALDKAGHTVFIAQSGFTCPESRKQGNVMSVRSFWLDIDCGKDKPYPSQKDGLLALKQFIDAVGLPTPSVVLSGRGLYAYWSMEADLTPPQWKGVARTLKELCITTGFEADPSRTSDTSSVLRPPGVYHKKDPKNPILVRVLVDQPSHDFVNFTTRVQAAAKKYKINSNLLELPKSKKIDINSEFLVGLEGPPCFSENIAAKCSQVGKLVREKGDVSEPLWYALIGLLRYAADGEEFIHKWSSGYSGYSHKETQAKIQQHNAGPTTCEYIAYVSPGGCVGCVSSGKIKTPLVLGREFKTVEVEDDRAEIPTGFSLTENGILFGEGGEIVQVYPYDIYPCKVSHDESLEYETMTIRHNQPHHGWKEFAVRSALMNDPRAFLMALADNHVQVVGADAKKMMVVYMEAYLQKLRSRQKMSQLCTQMGWKEIDGKITFILGDKTFSKGEIPRQIGFAKNVPAVASAFKSKGDIGKWVMATTQLNYHGAEGHAFALLVGAFGSPLLRFTGFNGALVCCLGESGIGKTLMGKWALSVYGDPSELMLYERDTMNSRISRLGLYGSLPVCIDEFTNVEEKAMSDFAFAVTQGRDKNRLSRGARERNSLNHWQTLAIVSTNMSVTEKLARLKGDSSPELNRVFEYTMREVSEFDRTDLTNFHRVISENYGHVGERYIQYLVDNYDEHRERLDKIIASIEKDSHATPSERFWVNIAGVAIYGGMIANKIGVTNFNIRRLYDWVIQEIGKMKGVKVESVTTPSDMIGDFLDRHAGKILIASGTPTKNNVAPVRVPLNEVVGLYLIDSKILYISRTAINNFCKERGASVNTLRESLQHTKPQPVLLSHQYKKALNHGVATLSGAPVSCWVIDMRHPLMGKNLIELSGTVEERDEENKKRYMG